MGKRPSQVAQALRPCRLSYSNFVSELLPCSPGPSRTLKPGGAKNRAVHGADGNLCRPLAEAPPMALSPASPPAAVPVPARRRRP